MTQVTALVLRAVAAGHVFGFDVMERCGLPSGTVYPALRRLERAGWLTASWEDADEARAQGRPRRRTYRLTERGRRGMPEAEAKVAEVARMIREAPAPDSRGVGRRAGRVGLALDGRVRGSPGRLVPPEGRVDDGTDGTGREARGEGVGA